MQGAAALPEGGFVAKPLGLGILGASADRGGHIHAMQQLRLMELTAVASGTPLNQITSQGLGFQSGRLYLLLRSKPELVGQGKAAALPNTAANVAEVSMLLRDDILNGTKRFRFNHAVHLARWMDDVMLSARTGSHTEAGQWPS